MELTDKYIIKAVCKLICIQVFNNIFIKMRWKCITTKQLLESSKLILQAKTYVLLYFCLKTNNNTYYVWYIHRKKRINPFCNNTHNILWHILYAHRLIWNECYNQNGIDGIINCSTVVLHIQNIESAYLGCNISDLTIQRRKFSPRKFPMEHIFILHSVGSNFCQFL